jgi:hypothetical protein
MQLNPDLETFAKYAAVKSNRQATTYEGFLPLPQAELVWSEACLVTLQGDFMCADILPPECSTAPTSNTAKSCIASVPTNRA